MIGFGAPFATDRKRDGWERVEGLGDRFGTFTFRNLNDVPQAIKTLSQGIVLYV